MDYDENRLTQQIKLAEKDRRENFRTFVIRISVSNENVICSHGLIKTNPNLLRKINTKFPNVKKNEEKHFFFLVHSFIDDNCFFFID